jgi:predicted small lipoprotein YifL
MKTLVIVIALAALAACNREGPAEKAGRQIDQTADKAGRSIEKAGDNVRDAVNGKK